jgi:hypothetical protein
MRSGDELPGERPNPFTILLIGLSSLAMSMGGVLGATVLWLVGPITGIVTIVLFLRLRPERQPTAGIGFVLGLASIVIPAALWLAWTFATD